MNSVIIFCAKYLIYIVFALAIGYWLTLPKKQKVQVVILGLITAIIAFILAKIGGAIYNDPRPFVSDHVAPLFNYTADNGFPSDHTLITASIAAAVIVVSKKWGLGFLALAVVIGTSRVLAHVHHPIDIAGSIIFAAIGGTVAYYASSKILPAVHESSLAKRFGFYEDAK